MLDAIRSLVDSTVNELLEMLGVGEAGTNIHSVTCAGLLMKETWIRSLWPHCNHFFDLASQLRYL